jgi:hypothetical protein
VDERAGGVPAATVRERTRGAASEGRMHELRPLWGPWAKVGAALSGVVLWIVFAGQVGLFDPDSAAAASLLGRILLFVFLAVALGWLVQALREATGFWHPRVVVSVSKRVPAPGDELEIAWCIVGRTHRVRSLELRIERRREPADASGWTYLPDWMARWHPASLLERSSRRLEVLEVTERHEIGAWPRAATDREGRASFRLPDDARASYASSRVRLRWVLVARLAMEGLPTLEQELALRVARRRG